MWSKLDRTDMWKHVENMMSDDRLHYHNFDHVLQMYHDAEHVFDFEYDLALDLAILWHDAVYDDQPDKELRSLKAYMDYGDYGLVRTVIGELSSQVAYHILKTENHVPFGDDRIIKLDLCGLSIPSRAEKNYELIKKESKKLYGISDEEFATNNIEFMLGLIRRVETSNDKFYSDVVNGINYTLKKSANLIREGL